MIEYHYETGFRLKRPEDYTEWLRMVVESEGAELGEVNYIFTSDEALCEINTKYLQHDYYTDIISFDYTKGAVLSGDIFISIDRVTENAGAYGVAVPEELKRVMVHGLLHFLGYTDDTEAAKLDMRNKENEKIKMFHVEQ